MKPWSYYYAHAKVACARALLGMGVFLAVVAIFLPYENAWPMLIIASSNIALAFIVREFCITVEEQELMVQFDEEDRDDVQ